MPQWGTGTPFAKVAKLIEFPFYAIALGPIGNVVLGRPALRDALPKGFRTWFLIFAFMSIGLEFSLRGLREAGRGFAPASVVNIVVGLGLASVLFSKFRVG